MFEITLRNKNNFVIYFYENIIMDLVVLEFCAIEQMIRTTTFNNNFRVCNTKLSTAGGRQ